MIELFEHLNNKNLHEQLSTADIMQAATFVGNRDAGFLRKDGSVEAIGAAVHYNHAKKMLQAEYGIINIEGNPIDVYLAKSGYIRFMMNGEELDISIVSPVTKPQLRKLYDMSKGLGFYYDITKPSGKFLSTGSGFARFVNDLRKYSLVSVTESSIDFSQDTLSDLIWEFNDNIYTIKSEVKDKILGLLRMHPQNLLDIAEKIRVVGSLCSTNYVDTSDLDVHVTPKNIDEWDEAKVKSVMHFYEEHRGKFEGFIGKHPIEIYIQTNPSQDLMSDGCYDLLQDQWEAGPTIRPKDYNPYDNFKDVFDEIAARTENADKLFGELKRDTIDYATMKEALARLDGNGKQELMTYLQDKLIEIEADIEALYKERKKWSDARKFASKPATPEEALHDVELAKSWADENAVFKFLSRYRYMKIIGDLHEMIADDVITDDEMKKMKKLVGVGEE